MLVRTFQVRWSFGIAIKESRVLRNALARLDTRNLSKNVGARPLKYEFRMAISNRSTSLLPDSKSLSTELGWFRK